MSDSATSRGRTLRAATLNAALAGLLLVASSARADDSAPHGAPPDLSKEAEEMSEAARAAIERFTAMLGPMLESFEQWIEDMPRYEAPEVLPNGDIIIRRIPKDVAPDADESPGADITDL